MTIRATCGGPPAPRRTGRRPRRPGPARGCTPRPPARLVPLLCAAALLAAGLPAAADPGSPIDALDQASLQETFRLLRTNYIQGDALTLEKLNRAALEGLLKRLDFGAELIPLTPAPTAAAPAPDPPGLVLEKLADTIGYLRPAAFTLDEIPAFDAALAALAGEKPGTLILDLRTPAPPAEFAVAASLLERFLPAGQPLFSVQKPGDPAPRHFRTSGPPQWMGTLMVLIDADCTNVAETVAAVLQRTLQAPLIGSPTRGRTMQYETAPLSATHALRFASAEMRLPDGASLFRKGLAPTLAVPADPDAKSALFARQTEQGVRAGITNLERPRHNEAALVAGTSPELPHQLAQSAKRPTFWDTPPLQDRTLQVAVDVLTARRVAD